MVNRRANKKSQAAMEFLMTYGWALIVIFVAIAALVFFDVLNSEKRLPDSVMLGPGLIVYDMQANETDVVLIVKNAIGRNIYDLSITATACDGGAGGTGTLSSLAEGKTGQVFIECDTDTESPDKFLSSLIISYETSTSGIRVPHSEKGRLVVTVSGGGVSAGPTTCSTILVDVDCDAETHCTWNTTTLACEDTLCHDYSAGPSPCEDSPTYDCIWDDPDCKLNTLECEEINSPGIYIMDRDLSATASCFVITSPGVTLDGAGYSITGNGATGFYGIHVQAGNVVIRNLTIDNFETGIYIEGVSNVDMFDVDITSTNDLSLTGSSSHNVFISGSFSNISVGPSAEIERGWNYKAHVIETGTGSPISGTRVSLYNRLYDLVGSFTTNSIGYTQNGYAIEGTYDGNSVLDNADYTRYFVNVEHSLYIDIINEIWNENPTQDNLTAEYELDPDTVLSIDLLSPANHSGVVVNQSFDVTVNVTCLKGNCGGVSVSLIMGEFVNSVNFQGSGFGDLDCFDSETDLCIGRLGSRGWNGQSGGPIRNNNSINWACGTCGFETSGYQHRIDHLYRVEGCVPGMSMLPGTSTCLKIGTGPSADYWDVTWTGWSQWSSGGFSYDRSQGGGPITSFTHSNGGTEEDCITPDVCITRARSGPVYNSQDMEWACGNCNSSPSTWSNVIQNPGRTFATNTLSCISRQSTDLINQDICMYVPKSGNYYDFDFDSWVSRSGWGYTREFTYPKTAISTIIDDVPFWTSTSNPRAITLAEGATEQITFQVTPTVDFPGEFEIYATANVTLTPEINDDSEHILIDPLSGGGSTMTLDSPEDDYYYPTVVPASFTCNASTTIAGAVLTSVTLNVWDGVGSVYYTTTDNSASGSSYSADFNNVNLALGVYEWNCEGAVDLGSTFIAENNFTVGVGISPECLSVEFDSYQESIYANRSYDYIYNVTCLPCTYGNCGNVDFTKVIALIEESTYFTGPGLDCLEEETDVCLGRIAHSWNPTGGPIVNNNSIAWACGTCGFETSSYSASLKKLIRSSGCQGVYSMRDLGAFGVQMCLKVGVGPTADYWDIGWTGWSCCGSGGFSYSRSQGGGPITSFTHSNGGTEEDCINPTTCITRGPKGDVYDAYDLEWACGTCNSSPSTWQRCAHGSSWRQRCGAPLPCLSSGQMRTSMPANNFCVHVLESDRYYDFDFDSWGSMGGAWSYNRTFSIPRTVMSTISGTEPFWTTSINPQTASLNTGDLSQVTFSVAAPQGDRFYTLNLEANISAQPNISALAKVNVTPYAGLITDVQLLSPVHNYYIAQPGPQSVSFSCSAETLDIGDLELTSITITVWDGVGTPVYTDTDSVSGQSATANFNTNLASGLYNWNCEAAVNYGAGYETSAVRNNSFGIALSEKCVDVELIYPTSDINVLQNKWFNFTVNVSCLHCAAGDCGTVNVTLDPIACNGGCVNLFTNGGRAFVIDAIPRTDTTVYGTAIGNCQALGATDMANFEESMAWVTYLARSSADVPFHSYMEDDVCTPYGMCCEYGWHDLFGCTCKTCSPGSTSTFSNGNSGGYGCVWRQKSGIVPTAPDPNGFFYTNKSTNPYQINLLQDQSQKVVFHVNATTDISQIAHEFFVYVNMTSDTNESNETEHYNISVAVGGTSMVELISPDDNSFESNLPIVINPTCESSVPDVYGLYLDDITLYIWKDGILEETYSKNVQGSKQNTTTFAHVITDGGVYEWNCVASDTWGGNNNDPDNYTIYVGPGFTVLENDGTASSWNDSTYAASCEEYRNPTLPYIYAGSGSGDGVYYINPLGSPLEVYCDMTTDGGGWTFFGHINGLSGGTEGSGLGFFNTPIGTYKSSRIDDGTRYSLGIVDSVPDTEMMVTLDSANALTADAANKIAFFRYPVGHVAFNGPTIPCDLVLPVTDVLTGYEYKVQIGGSYISGGTTNSCNIDTWYTRDPTNLRYIVLFHRLAIYGNCWGQEMGGTDSWYHDGWWYYR